MSRSVILNMAANGEPISVNFKYINPEATDAQLYATFSAIAELTSNTFVSIQRVDTTDIEEE